MKIFASYEHDNFEMIIKRIINDLKVQSFEIIESNNYPLSYDILLIFITHASMDKKSKCFNDINKAYRTNKKIVPIYLEKCELHYLLISTQYINFTDGNDYSTKLNELKNCLQKMQKIYLNK